MFAPSNATGRYWSYDHAVGFTFAYVLVQFCGLLGNGFIVLVVATNRNLRRDATNVLLANISAGKFIYLAAAHPIIVWNLLNGGRWTDDDPVCWTYGFLFTFLVPNIRIGHALFAAEKVINTINPLRGQRFSTRTWLYAAAVSWLATVAIATIPFFIHDRFGVLSTRLICATNLETAMDQKILMSYMDANLFVCYVVVLLSMNWLFRVAGRNAWRQGRMRAESVFSASRIRSCSVERAIIEEERRRRDEEERLRAIRERARRRLSEPTIRWTSTADEVRRQSLHAKKSLSASIESLSQAKTVEAQVAAAKGEINAETRQKIAEIKADTCKKVSEHAFIVSTSAILYTAGFILPLTIRAFLLATGHISTKQLFIYDSVHVFILTAVLAVGPFAYSTTVKPVKDHVRKLFREFYVKVTKRGRYSFK